MDGKEKQAILIVDDDEVFRQRLCRAFSARGWEAHEASDLGHALAVARECSPDLAVVDLRLPGESGLEIVRALRSLDTTTFIVMLTGYASLATALEAGKHGANHYLVKPVDVDQIISVYDGPHDALSATTPSSVASLARVEWEHIQRVLRDCGGNVSQTARLLGMHRRSLQRKLSKFPPPE